MKPNCTLLNVDKSTINLSPSHHFSMWYHSPSWILGAVMNALRSQPRGPPGPRGLQVTPATASSIAVLPSASVAHRRRGAAATAGRIRWGPWKSRWKSRWNWMELAGSGSKMGKTGRTGKANQVYIRCISGVSFLDGHWFEQILRRLVSLLVDLCRLNSSGFILERWQTVSTHTTNMFIS